MFLRTLSQTFARQPFLSDWYISNFDIKLRMNYSRFELYDRQNMPWPSNLKQGMNVLDRYSIMSWWQAVDLAATSTLQYSSLLHYYFTPILAKSLNTMRTDGPQFCGSSVTPPLINKEVEAHRKER